MGFDVWAANKDINAANTFKVKFNNISRSKTNFMNPSPRFGGRRSSESVSRWNNGNTSNRDSEKLF